MTKDVIALAEQAGMPVTDYGSGPFIDDGVTTQMLEKFATLAGNAKLEQAAKKCDALYFNLNAGPDTCAQAIRNLKEPTT